MYIERQAGRRADTLCPMLNQIPLQLRLIDISGLGVEVTSVLPQYQVGRIFKKND
jgi:hypothetical protein